MTDDRPSRSSPDASASLASSFPSAVGALSALEDAHDPWSAATPELPPQRKHRTAYRVALDNLWPGARVAPRDRAPWARRTSSPTSRGLPASNVARASATYYRRFVLLRRFFHFGFRRRAERRTHSGAGRAAEAAARRRLAHSRRLRPRGGSAQEKSRVGGSRG